MALNQAIGGQQTYRQFSGTLVVSGLTVTRSGDSALGNFSDEGFAAGQRIRLMNGSTVLGDFTIASVSGLTLTLSPINQLLIVAAMFVGRLGPLTLVLALASRTRPVPHRPAVESVRIG